MKKIGLLLALVLSSFLASSPALAAYPNYVCTRLFGEDVGSITINGDPVKNIYRYIAVGRVPQAIRSGITSNVYVYLFDLRTRQKTWALEVVNPYDSYDKFEMSVYGSDHIVLGSRKIARYSCTRM